MEEAGFFFWVRKITPHTIRDSYTTINLTPEKLENTVLRKYFAASFPAPAVILTILKLYKLSQQNKT